MRRTTAERQPARPDVSFAADAAIPGDAARQAGAVGAVTIASRSVESPAPGQWPWRTSGFPLYEHATAVPAGARRMPHYWMVNLGSAETLSRTRRRTIDGLCPSYWQVILVGSNHPRSGYHARWAGHGAFMVTPMTV